MENANFVEKRLRVYGLRLELKIILLGFTSAIFQVVLLRNIMISFYGNEFTIGIGMGFWLLGAALGSLIARILGIKYKRGFNFIWVLLMGFIIYLIYNLNYFGKAFFGELLPPLKILELTFIFVTPVAFCGGFIFVSIINRCGKNVAISRIYYLEAFGATLGGFLFGYILIRIISDITIILIVSLLSFLLIEYYVFFVIVLAIILYIKPVNIENFLNKARWATYKIVDVKNSFFQNIAVVEKNNKRILFTDGLYNFSSDDFLLAEYAVHLPAAMAVEVKRILVLQNLTAPMATELAKYKGAQIDYVELDPAYIRMLRSYFSIPEKIRVVTADPYRFLKQSEKKYDIIILNTPPPYSIQYNRYYTEEFFYLVQKHLNSGGVFSFHTESNPNAMSESQAKLLAVLKNALEKYFAQVFILPGELNIFIAGDQQAYITYSSSDIINRLGVMNIERKYVQDYYLFDKLNEFRVNMFFHLLNRYKLHSKASRPLPFLYSLRIWNQMFGEKVRLKVFNVTSQRALKYVVLVLLGLLVIWIFGGLDYTVATGISIFITGFAEMAFQIITIFLYQLKFGYVFSKMVIIFASFMLGLILGAKFMENKRIELRHYRIIQLSIGFYPLVLVLLYFTQETILIENFILPFLPVLPGFLGGLQFPAAVQISSIKRNAAKIAGEFYAFDLLGAFVGAVFISLVFIPVLGLTNTMFLVFLLCVFPTILLFLSFER